MASNDDRFMLARTFTAKELAKALWAELFCDNAFNHRSTEDLIENGNIADQCTISPGDIPQLTETIMMDYGVPTDVRPLVIEENLRRI